MVVSTQRKKFTIPSRVNGFYYSDFSDTVKVIW